jgi:A/G-specific adenine glycosylase
MTRTGPLSGIEAMGDEDLGSIRTALLEHYDRARRDLPWRGQSDPYHVWVSEVMLQQTRVETVIPYYRRWLARFPDVEALATAVGDEVLLTWQGLGYYRRARNLHAAARLVRERHDGVVPRSSRELRALPGVGEYTAGAIASIAFHEAVPAVDGNVRRVLSRLLDHPGPSSSVLMEAARRLVDPQRPGDWNQALMDLGATVCTHRSPDCPSCPVSRWCGAFAAGTQEDRPAPRRRKRVRESIRPTAVVVDDEGRALMERQPDGGLLGGLWAFPSVESGGDDGAAEVAIGAAKAAGARLREDVLPVPLPAVRHRFSHLLATYHPVLLRGEGPSGGDVDWIPLDAPRVALPVAQQKIARAAREALTP